MAEAPESPEVPQEETNAMDAEDGAPAQKEAVATAPVGASEAAEEAPPPEPAVLVAVERSPPA